MNLGLRYEYTTPYYGAGEYQNINFDPSTGQLVNATDDDKYLVDPDRNNFAPRLGVAYQAIPDRLVLRGGYGMFYSLEEMNGSEGMIVFNPPTTINATLQSSGTGPSATPAVILSDPFPASMLANYNPSTVSVKARDSRSARGADPAVERRGRNAAAVAVELRGRLRRQSRPRICWSNLPINAVQFGVERRGARRTARIRSGSRSTCGSRRRSRRIDSLQLKFEKRQSRGLYVLASYTFANAQEEVGAWGAGGHGIQDTLEPRLLEPRRRCCVRIAGRTRRRRVIA